MTNCFDPGNVLHAAACNGSAIIYCLTGFLMKGGLCEACPTIENLPSVKPFCNGTLLLMCYQSSIQAVLVY